MANPEVDNLIAELGGILNQNREKRNAADAMLMGIEQGKKRAALEAQNKAELASPTQSGYQKPGSVDPAYRYWRSSPDAAGGSPESRMALAQKMILAQQGKEEDQNVANDPEGNDVLGLGVISPNYRSGHKTAPPANDKQSYDFFRAKDPTPEALDPAVSGALRTDPKQAAAVDAAGNPDLGNFGSIAGNTNLGGPSSSYGGDKAYSLAGSSPSVGALRQSVRSGVDPSEMALLNELAKRYHSPEELSGR